MAATYTVGDGKTYSTAQAAVNAIPGDLSGQGIQMVEVYAKVATSNVYAETVNLLSGFTNAGVSDYIHFRAMVSHQGVVVAGQGISIAPVTGRPIAGGEYSRIEGFKVEGHDVAIGFILPTLTGKTFNNIVHDSDAEKSGQVTGISGRGDVYNNIIYNINQIKSGRGCNGIWIYLGNGARVYNNTVYNITGASPTIAYGIQATSSSNYEVVNNFASGNPSSRSFRTLGGAVAYSNNASPDAYADDWGANNLINLTMANQFTNLTPGSEDFRMKDVAADIFGAGTALGQLSPTDAVNASWNSPPSIGAFEIPIDSGLNLGPFEHNAFSTPFQPGAWR